MTADTPDFKVADLSLAAFGRKEIQLAEHEMPGLMAMRREYGDAQTLRGARITGSLLSIIPLVIAFLFLSRYWQSGLAAGGVKA